MEFTPEERREILDGLALREAREAQAKREEEASRKSEAERLHREELARVAQRKEDERKQRISDNLNQCLKLLQQAIASFEQGDEGGFLSADSKVSANHQPYNAVAIPSP
jgi:transposase